MSDALNVSLREAEQPALFNVYGLLGCFIPEGRTYHTYLKTKHYNMKSFIIFCCEYAAVIWFLFVLSHELAT